jgi:hypothetical protein
MRRRTRDLIALSRQCRLPFVAEAKNESSASGRSCIYPGISVLYGRAQIDDLLLDSFGEGLQQSGKEHPGLLAQYDRALLEIGVDELVKEWVQVIGRCREVEPGRIEVFIDGTVEFGHTFDDLRLIDKG